MSDSQVERIKIFSEDVSSKTKNIFMQCVKDYAYAPRNPILGVLKKGTEQELVYEFDTTQSGIKEKIQQIDTFISSSSNILSYHYFDFLKPSNNLEDSYSYDSVLQINEELYDEYRKKIIDNTINDISQIKNYYLFSSIEEIEKYYDGQIRPQIGDTWNSYRNYLLSDETISKLQNSVDGLKFLPKYASIKIPALRGNNNNLLSDFYYFLPRILQDQEYSNLELYKIGFLNLVKNAALRQPYPLILNNQLINPLGTQFQNFIGKLNDQDINSLVFNNNIYVSQDSGRGTFFDTNNFLSIFAIDKKTIFKDILEKKKTKFIPLFFKISKYHRNFSDNSPIQQIYIPVKEDEGIEYIDNQLLESETYRYNISMLGVSIGYSFTLTKEISSQDTTKTFYKISENNCQQQAIIFDIPFFKTSLRQRINPPAIPQATITSILGDANRIKIFMSTRASVEKPILFSEQESTRINEITDRAGNVSYTNKNFDSFSVYRVTEKPSSYESFYRARIASVPSNTDAFLDAIESNKKYYYTFRTIKGIYFSNPSEIYEVEIKNENGTIIPIIKTYFPDSEKVGLYDSNPVNRSIKNLVSLRPSFYQTNLIETSLPTGSYKDATFQFDRGKFLNLDSIYENGDVNEAKYKLRVISRSSGKAIDVNIKYRFVFKNEFKD